MNYRAGFGPVSNWADEIDDAARIPELVSRAFHVAMNGRPGPVVLALAEEAAAKDKVFALSLSAPFIPQFFKDPLDETAPYWDYLIGNETEARAYADSHSLATHDVAEIARRIADLPKKNQKRNRTVVITQGTDPTVVAVQGESDVRRFPVHEIDKAQICDTNGAGYVLPFLSPVDLFPSNIGEDPAENLQWGVRKG